MHSAFAQQGFAILPDIVTPNEITGVVEELAGLPARGKAGIRHALSLATVTALAHSLHLIAVTEKFIGPEAFPFRATLFNKSQGTNWLITWHQDTALPLRQKRELTGWGPWSVKEGVLYAHAPASALSQILALRVHLDDSTPLNGPLRVLPGTHRLGVLDDDQIHELSTQTASVTCSVLRGGVLAMKPLLIHASSKSDSQLPRRVLHIEYSAARVFADGLELAIA